MYKFFKYNLQVTLLPIPLYVMVEHNGDRISLGNIASVSKALQTLYDFEKTNIKILSPRENVKINKRFYLSLAKIRTNGGFFQRFLGLIYLIRSRYYLGNAKLIARLLMSDRVINLLKSLKFQVIKY